MPSERKEGFTRGATELEKEMEGMRDRGNNSNEHLVRADTLDELHGSERFRRGRQEILGLLASVPTNARRGYNAERYNAERS